MQMKTVEFQVESNVYQNMIEQGIDIQKKFREFLLYYDFIDDGYPTIGTAEAKRRVAEAVEHYKRSPEDFIPYDDDYWDDLDARIDAFKVK
ncbi:MAG: hypothetical protein GXO60_05240 [Epsilonproteobacteria bacterium]|nr:hypothetical protein [Campylobacterota bacterium]